MRIGAGRHDDCPGAGRAGMFENGFGCIAATEHFAVRADTLTSQGRQRGLNDITLNLPFGFAWPEARMRQAEGRTPDAGDGQYLDGCAAWPCQVSRKLDSGGRHRAPLGCEQHQPGPQRFGVWRNWRRLPGQWHGQVGPWQLAVMFCVTLGRLKNLRLCATSRMADREIARPNPASSKRSSCSSSSNTDRHRSR